MIVRFIRLTPRRNFSIEYASEIGVAPLCFSEFVYLPKENRFEEASKVAAGVATISLSGTEVREKYLERGQRLPEWFTRPEVAEILRVPTHRFTSKAFVFGSRA